MEILDDRRFQVQPSFEAHDYFEHALGITVLGDGEPETVVFECDPLLAKYLTSQPCTTPNPSTRRKKRHG